MAFTYTKIQETVLGNLRCWVGTLTFDNSYPTGGLAYTNASFGFSQTPIFMGFDGGTGYAFQNDRTNKKILAFRSAGLTPAGTNSAPTVTTGTSATTTAPVYTVGGALTQTTGAAGITGVQAPTFTGTAVAAASLIEVANAVDLSALVINVFVLGI